MSNAQNVHQFVKDGVFAETPFGFDERNDMLTTKKSESYISRCDGIDWRFASKASPYSCTHN